VMHHRLSTGKVLRRVPALRERCFSRTIRRLACHVMMVGCTSNAANPGWHGLQNTRSRHAAQTVEVVRNHEDGTSGERGSELPKGRPQGVDGAQASEILVVSRSGRATVKSAAGHERTNPKRGESGESPTRRSDGALKERPGSRGQQPPDLY